MKLLLPNGEGRGAQLLCMLLRLRLLLLAGSASVNVRLTVPGHMRVHSEGHFFGVVCSRTRAFSLRLVRAP